MKRTLVYRLIALLCLVAFAFSIPSIARTKTDQIRPQPTSVSIQKADILDYPGRPGVKKFVITLSNDSGKDVIFFRIDLSTTTNGRSGFGKSPKGKDKLRAQSVMTYEFTAGLNGVIRPALRCVVFEDLSFEGDPDAAQSFLITKSEMDKLIARYEAKLIALDSSENAVKEAGKLREKVEGELLELKDLDNLPLAKHEERFDRMRLLARRAALRDLLNAVDNIQKRLNDQPKSGLGLGKITVDNLKARS